MNVPGSSSHSFCEKYAMTFPASWNHVNRYENNDVAMRFLLLFDSAYFKQNGHRKKNTMKDYRKSSVGTEESSNRDNPQH